MNRINEIKAANKAAYIKSGKKWDSVAKPLGSFGQLETLIQQIAAIQDSENVNIDKRTVVVFCADHGVVKEGVTQTDSSVTAVCAYDIADGSSNVNAIADSCSADVLAVDIGMLTDVEHPKLMQRKVAYGTKNIAEGPAMTLEEAQKALIVGMDIAKELKEQGVKLLLTGEMGIGNTTPTSAIAAVLLGRSPTEVTGKGAGLSSDGLKRKIKVIERAISINRPDADKPIELIAKIGGLEIAGMTGLFLGGAYYKMPVVIDGVISAAAAALAYKINPHCAEYMLASHTSGEPAGEGLLKLIGAKAVIDAGLRLGEGTGGLLLLPLLDSALALYRNAHTFEDISIERYVEQK